MWEAFITPTHNSCSSRWSNLLNSLQQLSKRYSRRQWKDTLLAARLDFFLLLLIIIASSTVNLNTEEPVWREEATEWVFIDPFCSLPQLETHERLRGGPVLGTQKGEIECMKAKLRLEFQWKATLQHHKMGVAADSVSSSWEAQHSHKALRKGLEVAA